MKRVKLSYSGGKKEWVAIPASIRIVQELQDYIFQRRFQGEVGKNKLHLYLQDALLPYDQPIDIVRDGEVLVAKMQGSETDLVKHKKTRRGCRGRGGKTKDSAYTEMIDNNLHDSKVQNEVIRKRGREEDVFSDVDQQRMKKVATQKSNALTAPKLTSTSQANIEEEVVSSDSSDSTSSSSDDSSSSSSSDSDSDDQTGMLEPTQQPTRNMKTMKLKAIPPPGTSLQKAGAGIREKKSENNKKTVVLSGSNAVPVCRSNDAELEEEDADDVLQLPLRREYEVVVAASRPVNGCERDQERLKGQNYSSYPLLSEIPQIGDLLCYKLITLDAEKWEPKVSDYCEGLVINVDGDNIGFKLQDTGKKLSDVDVRTSSADVTYDLMSDLCEVRIISGPSCISPSDLMELLNKKRSALAQS